MSGPDSSSDSAAFDRAALGGALDAAFPGWLDTLADLVRIPSISARAGTAEGDRQLARSADAVAAVLEEAGLDEVHQASVDGSPPYVIGQRCRRPDRATVLLYAHHDVQPPGHLDRWRTDPFEPLERDGRLYGRGSADDKAGVVAHAAAVAAWLEVAGQLPCNVKVLVEGEEEIGSPRLQAFLRGHAEELASDVIVLADARNWTVGVPAITYSLRGLLLVDVRLRSLRGPVHSGSAGGLAPDPVMGLAQLLAGLTDERGDIAVAGFDDDVRAPTPAELDRLHALPPDGDGLRQGFGILDDVELAGDPGRTIYERLWFRPSLTVIGFDSHPVAGSSNQVVAEAAARLSVRLAPGQDPERAMRVLVDHLERHAGSRFVVEVEPGDAVPAWVTEPSGPAFEAARRALRDGFGREPVIMGEGGTIPFVGPFAETFGGIPALLIGPSDPTSAIHGENESVDLDDLRKLAGAEALLLGELAAIDP